MVEMKTNYNQAVGLGEVLVTEPPPFALLHRPYSDKSDRIEILIGDISEVHCLEDILLRESTGEGEGSSHDVLVIVPHRQIAERGFVAVNDGTPIIVMTVSRHGSVHISEALQQLPDKLIELRNTEWNIEDDEYAEIVRKIIVEEINNGEGSNFVISRSCMAEINNYSVQSALAIFARLLKKQRGAYWTFIVYTGDRTFIGASPERHVSFEDGIVTMNPISGTYRYPDSGVTLPSLLAFLKDRKEADELYMVLDEELKMMARLCELGARVTGPYLREMAQLAHTEYLISGRSKMDVRQILRESMFSPAVTGSPLESACRVIRKYEPEGRGYYGGILALISQNAAGVHTLDASILIRTADIDRGGKMQVRVGATLVRHSEPDSEVAETWAKAQGMIEAFAPSRISEMNNVADQLVVLKSINPYISWKDHPDVLLALEARNATLAPFWFADPSNRRNEHPALVGCKMLVIEAEDEFTSMLGIELRSLGLDVTIRRSDDSISTDEYDLVLIGPGPGDPQDVENQKIARLHHIIRHLLNNDSPFFAVCLGHQVLCSILGFELVRRDIPNQGIQRDIYLFGKVRRCGFYNTFEARSKEQLVRSPFVKDPVEVCRDASTGEVHALRGNGFASVQFHAESVLSDDGVLILKEMLQHVMLSRSSCKLKTRMVTQEL